MRTFKAAGASLATLVGFLFLTAGGAAAQAGIPMCNDVVNDPTIATCTCTCESSSQFSGCQGKSEGDSAPTPGQCPDMLQGRRVLSGGDGLLLANPHIAEIHTGVNPMMLYETKNDPNNPGLGFVNGTPVFTRTMDNVCSYDNGEPMPIQARLARLFDLPFDVAVAVHPGVNHIMHNCNSSDGTTPNLQFVIDSPMLPAQTVPALNVLFDAQYVHLAIDDFDYDGFDDVLFLNIDSIHMFTAVDTSDPTKGLVHMGGVSTGPASGPFQAPLNQPTTGDFNGDGLIDVAWIGGDFPNNAGTLSVFFATICPGDVPNTICAGAQPFQVILDPASRQFPNVSGATSTIQLANAPLTKTSCGGLPDTMANFTQAVTGSLRASTVVLGNFEDNGSNSRGAPIDELIVSYVSGSSGTGSDLCSTDIQYWSFSPPTSSTPSWARQRGNTVSNLLPHANTTQFGVAPIINLYSQAAYLDWYGPVEQAVIAVNSLVVGTPPLFLDAGSHWFPVTVSVSGAGEDAQPAACSINGSTNNVVDAAGPFIWGLAVGRFSTSTTINPDNSGACGDFSSASPGDCPYNLQIAMFLSPATNDDKAPSFRLYNVRRSQPGNTSLQCGNDPSVLGFLPQNYATNEIQADDRNLLDTKGFGTPSIGQLRGGSMIHVGDVFGNSVRVGNPTVTRISEHTQPQVVIQAPPSLIDYVNPTTSSSGAPAIVNFSRAPGQFNAEFVFSSSTTNTASTSQTTSHTGSTAETVSDTVKFGVPLISQITVKNKESWKQYHDHTTKDQLSTYFTTGLKTGGEIGTDDQVWWTQTTFNVFHFPVLGETVCPATVVCDPSNPSTSGCSAAASGVELTCSASGNGCECLSQGASASLCPAIPSNAGALSCSTSGDNVCCAQRQQQLYMAISGPQEVTRSTAPGSLLEWYQPKHEPGQILSYPSTNALLQARTANFQRLATFDNFSTGTNTSFETFTWQCGSSQGNSIATTTRHSFESDTSVTAGTNDLAKVAAGANVSVGFDYQTSTSIATLNTHTVAQSTASSVTLNMEPEAFYNTAQFAYSLQGELFGVGSPGVFDDPDIDVNGEAPSCETSGPLTVAFAANPAGSNPGLWWQSNPAYLQNIDVALNNPSRWRKTEVSDVTDTALQCRGPSNGLACYTNNEPPTETDAASVWGADFYSMKGLIVTIGGISGPQRTTAKVGDQVFLQLRVYNYSLAGIADKFPGSRVYARIYRQKLDVNEIGDTVSVLHYATDAAGQPLPAVPIGPTGLGDPTPITVLSPLGATTINGFNVSSDPRLDNISLATTSYIVPQGDECDEGFCDGAFYAYWATVWAEDASGNVVRELPGRGLGALRSAAFNPDTIYPFITDVPVETVSFGGRQTTFSNNVGMYKQTFAIVPAETSLMLDVAGPGMPRIHNVQVSSRSTLVGRPVIVSAQVASHYEATSGATVIFSDGDPNDGGTVFDAEFLPHIRANDVHTAQVHYTPTTCGTKEIFFEVASNGFADRWSTSLEVPCKGEKVPICHGGKNLSVSDAALQMHLRHGDTLGSCGNTKKYRRHQHTGHDKGKPVLKPVRRKGSSEVLICHRGKDLSVSGAALQMHLRHGDTLGSCSNTKKYRHQHTGYDKGAPALKPVRRLSPDRRDSGARGNIGLAAKGKDTRKVR